MSHGLIISPRERRSRLFSGAGRTGYTRWIRNHPFSQSATCDCTSAAAEFNSGLTWPIVRIIDRNATGMVGLSGRGTDRRTRESCGLQAILSTVEHNGVNGPNKAVYSDRGHGVRAPVVFYNGANERRTAETAPQTRMMRSLRRGRARVALAHLGRLSKLPARELHARTLYDRRHVGPVDTVCSKPSIEWYAHSFHAFGRSVPTDIHHALAFRSIIRNNRQVSRAIEFAAGDVQFQVRGFRRKGMIPPGVYSAPSARKSRPPSLREKYQTVAQSLFWLNALLA